MKGKCGSFGLGVAALALLASASASAATLARQCGAFGIVTYDPPAYDSAYEIWAAANGVAGAWDETDASGIHNVFRYAFDKPTGAITNPPLIDIEIEGGNAVVKTPPVAKMAGFTVSVMESSDVAGETVTARKPLDATGRTVFAMENAASRFYRLSATEASFGGVQLWNYGPYWAETNVGADEPWEYGYYFWWGDTVGYKRENGAWVASDGSNSNFSFGSGNTPTYNKPLATIESEGWVVSKDGTYVLAPEHDAARAHWGGSWRMPTEQDLEYLKKNCDWTWTTTNGVNGYVVRGRDDYSAASIFIPAAGNGNGNSLDYPDSLGYYWLSVPDEEGISNDSLSIYFYSGHQGTELDDRYYGMPVRPVRDAN